MLSHRLKDCFHPRGLEFDLYSADEIRQISVVQIITPLSMNAAGQALPGGLYDPLMGPHEKFSRCATCQRTLLSCSGHFGHIELPLPVINPLFNKTVLQIFRLSCINCYAIVMPATAKYLSIAQLKLLDYNLINEAQEAEYLLADFVADNDPDSKKKRKTSSAPDTEYTCSKFEEFVNKHLHAGRQKPVVENSRIMESFKLMINKRILSHAKASHKCPFCGVCTRKMTQFESKIIYALGGAKALAKSKKKKSVDPTEPIIEEEAMENEDDDDGLITQKYLTPVEARNQLRNVWLKEKELLQYLFPVLKTTKSECPTDVFFIDVLPVAPPKNRPSQFVNNMHVENPVNLALRHVVQSCAMIQYILKAMKNGQNTLSVETMRALKGVNGETLEDKLETCWNDLQGDVDHVMDRDKSKSNLAGASLMIGLKQIIEKKEGLFRMNMMGKRVNFAARTVITPDPNINIDEIGIPDVFAKVLTYPTNVTHANVYHLRQLVLNGPDIYPGAVAVKDERGKIVRLSKTDKAQREGFANSLLVSDNLTESSFTGVKTVYRHLQNGDLLLLNRQPSLHRPSIMAHRARVLHGEKVFRLHYANCKHYNADFDGDEMNAHFPQDEEARAEAAALVNVTNHFLVPKDGTPLGGLIQDHIVGAVKLTIRGKFFTQQDYHQLVFFALSNYHRDIETEPPTILKPVLLWSGKQIVSTIIKNLVTKAKTPLSFTSSAKIKHNEWRQWQSRDCGAGGHLKEDDMSESTVIFRNGELLTGVLDKVHLGATPYGLCHAFFELYGSVAVGALLSAFSRLMTSFLQWEGFTLGVKDVLVTAEADEIRRELMVKSSSVGPQAAAAAVGLPFDACEEKIQEKLEIIHRSRDVQARAKVDLSYKQTLNKYNDRINSACLPYGLVSIFPENNLQLLVQSGAKGSTVNTMQMSCSLGHIELEGKRPPLTVAGKSLPSFKPYELSPRAGGFVLGRFLTGIRPQEFFFHCMAGREGLIDTAVKTSRSGYLQRCLVKLLEGLVTQYDMTVRDSDGSVIQFLYGEDGLDVCRSQYLKHKQMKFLHENLNCILNRSDGEHLNKNGVDDQKSQIASATANVKFWKDHNPPPVKKDRRMNEFLKFCKRKSKHFQHNNGLNEKTGRPRKAEDLETAWRRLSDEDKKSYCKRGKRCPDPVISQYLPSTMGVISENLQQMMEDYAPSESDGDAFRKVVYLKAIEALSNPGDAVGVLAAQSVGEPSTQMTLNTFHFAGRGEMNVTLGIPRLREILMVASEKNDIKTPSMDIPFHSGVTEQRAEALRIELTRVTMAQVIEKVAVTEKLDSRGNRFYQLRFCFLPFSEYEHIFHVKPHTILKYVERAFLRTRLLPAMRRAMKIRKGTSVVFNEREKPQREGGGRGGEGNEEDDDGADANEVGEKAGAKNKQQLTEDEVCELYNEGEKTGQGEDHVSSDEESEVDDADATQEKRTSRRTDREYEEPEAEEQEQIPNDDDEGDNGIPVETNESETENNVEGEEVYDDEFFVTKGNFERRKANMLALDPMVFEYDFDDQNQEWCQITLKVPPNMDKVNMGLILKEVAARSIIHQVQHITRAFVASSEEKISLKTEGINILGMYKYQHLLDLNKLHCNNIHTMAKHYGIEAALKVLIKELTDVFKAYAITIDPRHLSLIADYMTNSGTYRAFNRFGIASSTSPLHQMSFETVVSFLRDATLNGKRDDLQNPSSRIVVGQSIKVGAELFSCEATLSALPPGSKRVHKLQEKTVNSCGTPIYRASAPLSAFKSRRQEGQVS